MKKGLPKAQKGLAKLAKVVKTASKTAGNTRKGAKPVVRKATRIANAQKNLSASSLSGMTASQLRQKLSSLMKEASTASKAKSTGKKLALKQKGGTVGKGKKTTYKSLEKALGKPKKLKAFVGKRKISEKAAKRKVAKGKGMISYRVGGKDPGPGVYSRYAKKKTKIGNTGMTGRKLKGKGRTIRKKG